MPYEHRFDCTTKRRKDYRHDPSHAGIFIHGGTCMAGPFFHNNAPNRFGVTLPTSNRKGKSISVPNPAVKLPTFHAAVEHAKRLRDSVPELAGCDIFACTDLQMDTTYSGKYEVQRVA